MSVITLHPHLLAEAAHRLSLRIQAKGCEPTLIVGIQSGGAKVAQLMRADFPDVAYSEVRISRPSTQQKEHGLTHRLLQHMPLWLCDMLRVVESRIGEWCSRGSVPQRVGTVDLRQQLPAGSVILLVDDAIDTGATIHSLCQQLSAQWPQAIIRVAVITVTTSHPVCDADFCLYHNRTLCRFPWSNDYRPESVNP